jgi:cobalamin biosynthesis Mg chelatase CobN
VVLLFGSIVRVMLEVHGRGYWGTSDENIDRPPVVM